MSERRPYLSPLPPRGGEGFWLRLLREHERALAPQDPSGARARLPQDERSQGGGGVWTRGETRSWDPLPASRSRPPLRPDKLRREAPHWLQVGRPKLSVQEGPVGDDHQAGPFEGHLEREARR